MRTVEPWSGAYAENPEAVCSTTIHSFMTSTCSHEEPAIVVQQAKCITNLHLMKIGYRTRAAARHAPSVHGAVTQP